jgi:hypothetical protein
MNTEDDGMKIADIYAYALPAVPEPGRQEERHTAGLSAGKQASGSA